MVAMTPLITIQLLGLLAAGRKTVAKTEPAVQMAGLDDTMIVEL